jgi:hypothetical protein
MVAACGIEALLPPSLDSSSPFSEVVLRGVDAQKEEVGGLKAPADAEGIDAFDRGEDLCF